MSDAGAKYDREEVRRIKAEIAVLDAPLRKTAAPSYQTLCKLRSKAKLDHVIRQLNLDNSKVARLLGMDESTVRAWRDPDQPKKAPGDWVFDALGREALIAAARFSLVRIDELDLTGTER